MHPSASISRPIAFVAGVLAAVCGVALGHLSAAFGSIANSPILAVGSAVIDLTPTPVKEFAIREFGTNDKPILIGSVLVFTLLLSGIGGLLARRNPAYGVLILLVLIALAAAAVLTRPTVTARDLVPTIVAGVGSVLALLWVVRRPKAHAAGGGISPQENQPVGARRRVFLQGALLAAIAAAAGTAGTWLAKTRASIGNLVLPAAAEPAPALPTGLEVTAPGISPLRTPTAEFYRVDTKLAVPIVDVDAWSLTIDGDVSRPTTLSFSELLALQMIERDITLTCVSNEVGGSYLGSARWLGVRLNDLLELAQVGAKADQLLSTDVEGFRISTPLDVARDGRDTMVAVAMNDEPLTREHGFPARLVTPGLYGFVGATKWLSRLTLTTYAAEQAYWTERDWATDAPIKVSSRIDTPKPLARLQAGRVAVGGVAWAQHRGVGSVEVSVDGSRWRSAKLGPDVGVDYWRQWVWAWDATPGQHTLSVRATTLDGEVQTGVRVTPFPSGSTGIQELVVTVT